MNPKKQLNLIPILLSYLLSRKTKKAEALRALESRILVLFIDYYKKRYHKLMERSGLLFDRDISYPKLIETGHQHASVSGFNEATVVTGRYLFTAKEDVFDGMVNLASFNCQPAMNAQAIIRPLAAKSDIPYVTLDCEGPYISANQRRLLETVALQAKRLRAEKIRPAR